MQTSHGERTDAASGLLSNVAQPIEWMEGGKEVGGERDRWREGESKEGGERGKEVGRKQQRERGGERENDRGRGGRDIGGWKERKGGEEGWISKRRGGGEEFTHIMFLSSSIIFTSISSIISL